MKICQVGDGQSIHIKRWAGWLREHGHEVSMVSLTPNGGDVGGCYDDWLQVIPIYGPLGYLRTGFQVRALIEKAQPDVVHGHFLSSAGFHSSLSKRPKIQTAWGSDIYVDAKIFLKRQCIKYAIKHSSIVLGECDHILNEVRGLVPKANVRKVIFGIDGELFRPQPIEHDKFTFLSVRSTGGVYSPLVIVQAFEGADMDAVLMMQEPMADAVPVKHYVKSRPDLDKKVIWYSRRAYEEMPSLINSADVGISLPVSDSTSQAMMECMVCGVPVIASDIPVNREWIDSTSGVLSPIDVTQLSLRMQLMMNADLTDMKTNARKKIIENADFETEMLKAERIYKEVVE